jgi:ERF superfamily
MSKLRGSELVDGKGAAVPFDSGVVMTLAEKLHAIQKLARKVPKIGYNEREDFHYMRIEDVISVATRFMAKYRLLLVPTVNSVNRTMNDRGGGSIVDVMVKWELIDLDDRDPGDDKYPGHVCAVEIPGSGWDFNSKATAKALTDSRKSAMILLFNLKGGDDPEERGPVARDVAKDAQQTVADKKLANAAAGRGLDADTPKLFYEIFAESDTVKLTGDKELLKHAALKPYKLGRDFVVPSAAWDALKLKIEEAGIPLSNLRTQ